MTARAADLEHHRHPQRPHLSRIRGLPTTPGRHIVRAGQERDVPGELLLPGLSALLHSGAAAGQGPGSEPICYVS